MKAIDFSHNRLRQLREEEGLSQRALSSKTGISQANLSRWEKNTVVPNVLDCWKLAEYYSVTVDYLIGWETE